MGRSLKDLIETLNVLKDRGVDFISVTENIDTTTPGGKLIFQYVNARSSISERRGSYVAFSCDVDLCLQHASCSLCAFNLYELWTDVSYREMFTTYILVSLLRLRYRCFDTGVGELEETDER